MKCYAADWPAPSAVQAWVSSREEGASRGAFARGNLGEHVADDSAAVAQNRAALQSGLADVQAIQWLEQVHGTRVIEATRATVAQRLQADAVITRVRGLACAVLTADCLPVIFCDIRATQVAAAHAGWRGLAAGILERTIEAFDCPPQQVMAWLGPAIGPCHFEVGEEVRDAFVQVAPPGTQAAFSAAFVAKGGQPGKWQADLYQLARLRLQAAGVQRISGGGQCTYCDSARWYSYRREPKTGRVATLVYLR